MNDAVVASILSQAKLLYDMKVGWKWCPVVRRTETINEEFRPGRSEGTSYSSWQVAPDTQPHHTCPSWAIFHGNTSDELLSKITAAIAAAKLESGAKES